MHLLSSRTFLDHNKNSQDYDVMGSGRAPTEIVGLSCVLNVCLFVCLLHELLIVALVMLKQFRVTVVTLWHWCE